MSLFVTETVSHIYSAQREKSARNFFAVLPLVGVYFRWKHKGGTLPPVGYLLELHQGKKKKQLQELCILTLLRLLLQLIIIMIIMTIICPLRSYN